MDQKGSEANIGSGNDLPVRVPLLDGIDDVVPLEVVFEFEFATNERLGYATNHCGSTSR